MSIKKSTAVSTSATDSVAISREDYEYLLDIKDRYAAASHFAPSMRKAGCGHYVCRGYICMTCGKDPTQSD